MQQEALREIEPKYEKGDTFYLKDTTRKDLPVEIEILTPADADGIVTIRGISLLDKSWRCNRINATDIQGNYEPDRRKGAPLGHQRALELRAREDVQLRHLDDRSEAIKLIRSAFNKIVGEKSLSEGSGE